MSNAFASNLDTNAQSTIEEEQSRVSTIEQLDQEIKEKEVGMRKI